ncbi:hypothetical protein HD554DRAFT_2168656 [Boletus coccyginus]|nr:hypothetical protein HD554DRAFT_2168656 [Boletus coccyginus]
MSIMHPEMYDVGREAMIKLWEAASGVKGGFATSGGSKVESANILKALCLWPSVYSSLSVVANRSSAYHLDQMGKWQWFDQLLTVGNYGALDLAFPTLLLNLHYPPGTVVVFSGKLLVHGASKADRDHGCIAWYMQDKVHKAMGVAQCSPAHL